MIVSHISTELHFKQSKRAFVVESVIIQAPVFLAFLLVYILSYGFFVRYASRSTYILVGLVFFAMALLLSTLITVVSRLGWRSKEYIITKDRIIVAEGIIGTTQKIYNVKGSTGMRLIQTPIRKLFNYGTISISFLGGDRVNLANMSDPYHKLQLIEELIDKGEVIRGKKK